MGEVYAVFSYCFYSLRGAVGGGDHRLGGLLLRSERTGGIGERVYPGSLRWLAQFAFVTATERFKVTPTKGAAGDFKEGTPKKVGPAFSVAAYFCTVHNELGVVRMRVVNPINPR